jgi:hypothetical protein
LRALAIALLVAATIGCGATRSPGAHLVTLEPAALVSFHGATPSL